MPKHKRCALDAKKAFISNGFCIKKSGCGEIAGIACRKLPKSNKSRPVKIKIKD